MLPILNRLCVRIRRKRSFFFFSLIFFSQLGIFSQDLGLTPDESNWLNKHRNQIIYAPAPSWPPGEYIDENGIHRGIIAEYIKIFEQKLGVHFKIASYSDWDDVVNALKNANVDFIGGIQETPERDSFFYFTKPFLKLSFVILVRKNYGESLTPERIGSMKLAGVKNYTTTDFIKTKYHNANILECPDDLTALLQTSLGNTEGTIIDLMTASYLVQKYGINNLSIGRNIDYSWDLSFACRKQNRELGLILDKLLASIDHQQREEIYNKWVNITIPEKTYIERHTQLIIISGGILLLLLIIIIPYNVVLRRQVKKRTSDLKHELEEKNHAIQLLNKWQEQLIAAKNKAEEGDRLKSAFLANMSHEIRTPMNGIVGFASFLQNEDLSREQIERYSSIIIKSSNQLLNIVNDILEISRLETNQVKISYSEFDLKGVFAEFTALFKSQAVEKNLAFSVNLPPRKRIMITSDETKLKQILFNLAGNALKFTEQGKIEAGFQFDGDFLKFYVKDTGIGIEPGMQEAIFERFRQADVSTSRLYGGTGLGLSISKAFVELLGGKIWVESEPSKGSVFYFTIPYLASEYQNDLPELEEDTFDFPLSTILIAEDEEANQYYLQVIFEPVNVNIILVADGAEAVEAVKKNPAINLVLLDIKMPVMNGLEAARIIKTLRPGLPLIAQTAFSQPDEHDEAIKAGFDEFITKPIHKENLLKLISSYLNNPM